MTRGSPNIGRVDSVEKKKVSNSYGHWLLVALEGTSKAALEEIFKVASDVTCKVVSVVKTCKGALEEKRICKGALVERKICKGALEERKICKGVLEERRTLCKAVLDARRIPKAVLDARKSKAALVVTSCREDSDEKRRTKVALAVKRTCKVVSDVRKSFKDDLDAKKCRDALGGTKLRRMKTRDDLVVRKMISLQS